MVITTQNRFLTSGKLKTSDVRGLDTRLEAVEDATLFDQPLNTTDAVTFASVTTGDVAPATDNTNDLGQPAKRFRKAYCETLNPSFNLQFGRHPTSR